MPRVRMLASAHDLPDGRFSFQSSAFVLGRLARSDLASTSAARRAIASLARRFNAACEVFESRLVRFAETEVRARLGRRYDDALTLASVGPAVEVSGAELALLSVLAQAASAPELWQAHPHLRFGSGDRRLLGEVLEALGSDDPGELDAPSLDAFFPPPVAPVESEGNASDEAPPVDPNGATDPAPAIEAPP